MTTRTLPKGWADARLGDVIIVQREGVAPESIRTGTTYVGLEHIGSDGQFIEPPTVQAGELASQKFRFKPDHVLFGKLRPYLAKIAAPDFSGVCSTDILPLRPGSKLDRRYLLHHLRRPETVRAANGLASGANLPRLSPSNLIEMRMPLPPIEEQRRIAAVLDQANELRAKRRTALALLDTLTESIFLTLFPADTPAQPLGNVVAPGTVVTYGIVQAGPEFPGGVPYIRTGDLVDGQVRETDLRHTDPSIASKFARSRVVEGDIVMSIRATVGTTARVGPALDGANLTQGTARISPGPEVTGEYLLQHLRNADTQAWIQRQVKGATFREITLTRLRELPVPTPPLALQQRFSFAAQSVLDRRSQFVQALKESDNLFASLQQRAFRGEL